MSRHGWIPWIAALTMLCMHLGVLHLPPHRVAVALAGSDSGAGVALSGSHAPADAERPDPSFPTPTSRAPTRRDPDPGPFPPSMAPVHLPLLGWQGEAGACEAWIHVQSVGREPGKAILLAFGSAAGCETDLQASGSGLQGSGTGLVGVACSGLLQPGGTWIFRSDALPPEARSAVLLSFNMRTTIALRVPDPTGDDVPIADLLCRELTTRLAQEPQAYPSFRSAYESGLRWADVPLGLAYGPELAVSVERRCQTGAGGAAVDAYAGLAGASLGQPGQGISSYFVYPLYGNADGRHSFMHVQNADLACVDVEVWLQAADACKNLKLCQRFGLGAGAARTVDVAACTASGWQGWAMLTGRMPRGRAHLAVVAEHVGPGTLCLATGVASELRFGWDAPPVYTPGSPVLYAPLPFGPSDGFETRLHVQNLNARDAARVRLTFVEDGAEHVLALEDDEICPNGVATFAFRPRDVWLNPIGGSAGSVRIESLRWAPPGGAAVEPPNLSAVVELIRREPNTQAVRIATTYRALAEPDAFDWPVGRGQGGLTSGRGRLALTLPGRFERGEMVGDANDLGRRECRLVISNLVPMSGFTQCLVTIFDANSAVASRCVELMEGQTSTLDLAIVPGAASGFRGSALISALSWRHPVQTDLSSPPIRNLVGLAAMAIAMPAGVQDAEPLERWGQVDGYAAVVAEPLGTDASVALADAQGIGWSEVPCLPAPTALPHRPLGMLSGQRLWLPWIRR